jgi:hypothetical protein
MCKRGKILEFFEGVTKGNQHTHEENTRHGIAMLYMATHVGSKSLPTADI